MNSKQRIKFFRIEARRDKYLIEMQEMAAWELQKALKITREEPGLSLRKISNVIKEVFDKAEVKSLIKELTD